MQTDRQFAQDIPENGYFGESEKRPAKSRRTTKAPTNEGGVMSKQITCECGAVIRGDSELEVVQGARDHMRADHPDLLDKVSDDDLRGWIEEV